MPFDYIDLATKLQDEANALQTEIDAMIQRHSGLAKLIELAKSVSGIEPADFNAKPPSTPAKPKPAQTGPTPSGHKTKYDYAAIARWIANAKANGSYSTVALAAAFNVHVTKVANWIGECRKRGLLTNDNKLIEAPRPATRIGGKVLACNEPGCEAEFPIDKAAALITHCVGVHGRQATHDERQPVAA